MVTHMMNGPFAILSAQQSAHNVSPAGRHDENQKDQQLKTILQEQGYGFFPTDGSYLNAQVGRALPEKSVFVVGIPEGVAQRLSRDFKQDAYIWGNHGHFWLKGTGGNVIMDGDVADWFQQIPHESSMGYTEIQGRKWRFAPPSDHEIPHDVDSFPIGDYQQKPDEQLQRASH